MRKVVNGVLFSLIFTLGLNGVVAADENNSRASSVIEELEEQIYGKYSGQPVSLQLHDTDIHSALRIFSEIMNTNIVAHRSVTGNVSSLLVKDVPVDQAFATFVRMYGLHAVIDKDMIVVYPIETYLEEVRHRIELMKFFE